MPRGNPGPPRGAPAPGWHPSALPCRRTRKGPPFPPHVLQPLRAEPPVIYTLTGVRPRTPGPEALLPAAFGALLQVSSQVNEAFASLGLIEPLLLAVDEMNYTEPTPVQVKAIPPLLDGRDMLAAAQTGTGKTAAYSLPIIQKIAASGSHPGPKEVTALILAPTRELAAQIHENIVSYSKHLDIRSSLVFGGVNIKPQTQALARGVDILVATPGRLLDHVGQKNVTLGSVRFLVLDEADRMLDMGFIHDIRKIIRLIPEDRQSLLFSATFSPDIRKLADSFLRNPVSVEISPNKESALIRQQAYAIPKKRKRELLRDLIVDGQWSQVLVFTRMKHAANRLCQQLVRDGISAAAIHGNKSQNARTKALADFKAKRVRVLVATDIAARGLDIEQLPHVVNYDLPDVPEDYVHRIGRTGRAGVEGHAVSLVSPEDRPLLAQIEKLLKEKIELITPDGYDGPMADDLAEEERKEEASERKASRKPASGARQQPRRRKTAVAQAAADECEAESRPETSPSDSASDRDTAAPARRATQKKRGAKRPAARRNQNRRPAPEAIDPDDFGNSINYRPRRSASKGQRNGEIARYEPKDPFAPEEQALFLPQSMPGERPYEAGPAGRRRQNPRRKNQRGPRAARSTDYFEQNSRYSNSLTRSNLPPGIAPRRNRSRGR